LLCYAKVARFVDRGLSLEQLAEQTGLSKSALGKYESEDFKDISPFAIVTLALAQIPTAEHFKQVLI